MDRKRSLKRILAGVMALSMVSGSTSSEMYTLIDIENGIIAHAESYYDSKACDSKNTSPKLTASSGTEGNPNESYPNLFDNNQSTKWGVNFNGSAEVEFSTPEAGVPVGYHIRTANDNSGYNGRNPKSWILYGKKDTSDQWTEIEKVDNDTKLQDVDFTLYDYTISNCTTAYKYYKFKVTSTKGAPFMQISEFSLDVKGEHTVPEETEWIWNQKTDGNWEAGMKFKCGACNKDVTVEADSVDVDGTYKYAEVTVNGKLYHTGEKAPVASIGESSFTTLQSAFDAAVDGDTVKLQKDVKANAVYDKADANVTLDLNGYGITASSGSVLNVKSGKLTITDSNPDAVHYYTIPSPTSNGAGLAVVDDSIKEGTQTFKGGYITGGKTGGIKIDAGASVTMNGGTVIGNEGAHEYGGVYIEKGAEMTMNGGYVIGNYASDGGAGVNARGIFVMTGGTIAYNHAGGCGGGIRTHAPGGDVSYAAISGGSIINNYASGRAGGVGEGKVVIHGAPVIRDNYNANGKDNVYVLAGKSDYYIVVDGEMTNTTQIGVRLPNGVSVFAKSGTTNFNDAAKFTSDNENYGIKKVNGELKLAEKKNITFETNGGSLVDVATDVRLPDPLPETTKTDYVLLGWYTDSEFANEAKAGADIDDDITLYAKWREVVLSDFLKQVDETTYEISTDKEYAAFADYVNKNHDCAGLTFILTNDIKTNKIVGTAETKSSGTTQTRPFSGTFDGAGHTLNVDITDNSTQGAAPFRYIKNAVIKNLRVTGTVNSDKHHAAGLVGFTGDYREGKADSVNHIENCIVSTTVNGGEYTGGIVGHALTSTVTYNGCVFDGIMTGSAYVGAIQGWGDGSDSTVKSCFFIMNEGQKKNGTLWFVNDRCNCIATDCYKTVATKDTNASLSHTIECAEDISLNLGESKKSFEYDGIKVYENAVQYNGKIYGAEGKTFKLTAKPELNLVKLLVNNEEVNFDKDNLSFVMPKANAKVSPEYITVTFDTPDGLIYSGKEQKLLTVTGDLDAGIKAWYAVSPSGEKAPEIENKKNRDAYNRIQAEKYDAYEGSNGDKTYGHYAPGDYPNSTWSDDGVLGWISKGDAAVYKDVDFGEVEKEQNIILRYSSGAASTVSVWIDGKNKESGGTKIKTLTLKNTANWEVPNTVNESLDVNVTGKHDVYLVFDVAGLNVDYFAFTGTEWKEELPSAVDAGTYEVKCKLVDADNKVSYLGTFENTIAKKNIGIVKATAEKVYDGKAFDAKAFDYYVSDDTKCDAAELAALLDDVKTKAAVTFAKSEDGSEGDGKIAGTYKADISIENPNYEVVTLKEMKAVINKADLKPEAPSERTATYGQKLSEIALPEAENGKWSWDAAAETTVGTAGSHKFTAVFTPNDTNNYVKVSKDVTVNVAKADVTVKEAPSAAGIVYEKSLADSKLTGGTVLFGEKPVKGTFAWKDGTVKPSVADGGKTKYAVVFTPEDNNNFNTAACEITLAVAKAEPKYAIPEGLKITYGKALKDVTLPEGWTWNSDADTKLEKLGDNVYKATFTPKDTANYNTVTKNLTILVYVDKTALKKAISDTEAYTKKFDEEYHTRIFKDLNKALKNGKKVDESLTVTQDQIDTATADLEEALAYAEKLVNEINHVQGLIDAIGEISYTDECKAKIDAAREAYDALLFNQQMLVKNYQVLIDAESEYEKLGIEKYRIFKVSGQAATHTESGLKTYWKQDGFNYEDDKCTKKIDDLETWIVIPAEGHNWGEWVTKNPATCTESGLAVRTCEDDGATETKVIPATGEHKFGEWKVKKAPTCTENGIEERVCAECGKTETREIKAAGEHKYGKPVYTWSEDGKSCTATAVCETDKKSAVTETAEITSAVKTAATCDKAGVTTYTAKFKNELFSAQTKDVEDIPAIGHKYSDWTVAKEATCDEDGTEIRKCEHCGNEETRAVLATGHELGEWKVTKAATCEENGIETRYCTHDDGTLETREIKANGHEFGEWTVSKKATCEEDGLEIRKCAHCGKEETRAVPALGHKFSDWKTVAKLTDETDGLEVRTCEHCGREEARATLAAGHAFGEWVVTEEATCEKTGIEIRYCDHDDGSFETREIKPLGHKYGEWTVSKAATCEEDGLEVRVCEHCGKKETRALPATGHKLGEWTVYREATCSTEGIEVRKCEHCDKEETRSIPAAEHKFGNWTVTKEATCDTDGLEVSVCEICGIEETRVVPATGHKFGEWTVTKAVTDETDGYETRKCEVCGKEEIRAVMAPGHELGEWKVTKEATCEENGIETRYCNHDDGTFETRDIKAIGHKFGDWTVTKAATCDENGIESRICEHCGKEETRVLPAVGHKYGLPVYTWSEDGKTCTATVTCENDKTHVITEKATVTAEVKTAATCDKTGVTTYTAKFENKLFSTKTKDVTDIPATGEHKFSEWKVKKAATCTEAGIEERFCTECGKTETREIPALGHKLGAPVYTWSADGKTCTATATCENDKTYVVTETAKITSVVAAAATCDKAGVTTYTASFENKLFSTQTKDVADIPATGEHKFGGWHVTITANAEHDGTKEHKCEVCGLTETASTSYDYHESADEVTDPENKPGEIRNITEPETNACSGTIEVTDKKEILDTFPLTNEECDQVENGKDIGLKLEVTDISGNEGVKEKADEAVKDTVGENGVVAAVLDVSIHKYIDGQDAGRVTQLNKVLKVYIDLPAGLYKEGRTFYVVREHEGKYEALPLTLVSETSAYFESDQYSQFYIVYTEAHEHEFGEWKTSQNASWLHRGYEERTCECGEKETRRVEESWTEWLIGAVGRRLRNLFR